MQSPPAGFAREFAWTEERFALKVAFHRKGNVMLEHRGTFARCREGGFSHCSLAPQDGPDLGRQPNFLQAPRQALAHPFRMPQGRAARDGNQDDPGAEDHGEPLVTYRLQPDLCGETRQPRHVRDFQPCA